jgi:hypothetical protein
MEIRTRVRRWDGATVCVDAVDLFSLTVLKHLEKSLTTQLTGSVQRKPWDAGSCFASQEALGIFYDS